MVRRVEQHRETSSLEKRHGSWRTAADHSPEPQGDRNDEWFNDDTVNSAKKRAKSWVTVRARFVVGAVLVLVAATAVWWWISRVGSSGVPGIESDKFQAVFLIDGTAYVGKLQSLDNDHYKLTNAYFITAASTPVTSDKDVQGASQGVALSRLDTGLLSPQNEIIIPKDKVILYENLKSDGNAAKLIADDLKKK